MAVTRRHRNERVAAAIVILLAIAGVLGLRQWSTRQQEALDRELTYIPKPAKITPEILLLQEYVRIDTSHPRGASDGARWLAAYLQRHGVRAELIASTPEHLNVYARIKGAKPGNGLLLFNHIDVVRPGDGWRHPPFEGKIDANQLHGRGVLDMKALAVCQLLAFLDVARSGRPPAHDLVFLGTADEETGSRYGMKWLLEHRPDVFEGVAYGVTESGLTEMVREDMAYFGIEVGSKQLIDVTLAGPDQDTMRRARIALEPYIDRREPDRILPMVRRYFHDVAPSRIQFRHLLTDIDRTVAEGKFWQLPYSYRDLTRDSLFIRAPRHENGRWLMDVRMLNLTDSEPRDRLAWLEKQIAPFGAAIVVRSSEGPAPMSSPDTPLFRLLAETARRRYRTHAGVQVIYRSYSDSRHLRARGIICYGISPYPVDYFQSISIHKANERIRLDWFMQGVAYTRDVVRAWSLGQ